MGSHGNVPSAAGAHTALLGEVPELSHPFFRNESISLLVRPKLVRKF
jgi:hypothetical protein